MEFNEINGLLIPVQSQPKQQARVNMLSSPPCKYCAGTGQVRRMFESDGGAYIQAGIILNKLPVLVERCPICNGCSWGEPYGTDRRSDEQKAKPLDDAWLLLPDKED